MHTGIRVLDVGLDRDSPVELLGEVRCRVGMSLEACSQEIQVI